MVADPTRLSLDSGLQRIKCRRYRIGSVPLHWHDFYEIELVTEGDTYPRPRLWVSSSILEGYDMILRADGYTHTILKYMLDYNSSPSYETGYVYSWSLFSYKSAVQEEDDAYSELERSIVA